MMSNNDDLKKRFDEHVNGLPAILDKLLASDFYTRDKLNTIPAKIKGVYVFYEGDKAIYVGRTDRMRSRLLEHSRGSSSHFSASFAFLLAREQAKISENDKRTRSELCSCSDFSNCFLEQKERVSKMRIKIVAIDNSIDQMLFEVYASFHFGTNGNYNTFHTT